MDPVSADWLSRRHQLHVKAASSGLDNNESLTNCSASLVHGDERSLGTRVSHCLTKCNAFLSNCRDVPWHLCTYLSIPVDLTLTLSACIYRVALIFFPLPLSSWNRSKSHTLPASSTPAQDTQVKKTPMAQWAAMKKATHDPWRRKYSLFSFFL